MYATLILKKVYLKGNCKLDSFAPPMTELPHIKYISLIQNKSCLFNTLILICMVDISGNSSAISLKY